MVIERVWEFRGHITYFPRCEFPVASRRSREQRARSEETGKREGKVVTGYSLFVRSVTPRRDLRTVRQVALEERFA